MLSAHPKEARITVSLCQTACCLWPPQPLPEAPRKGLCSQWEEHPERLPQGVRWHHRGLTDRWQSAQAAGPLDRL